MSSPSSRRISSSTITSSVKDSRKSARKAYHNRLSLSQLSPSRKWDVELWRRDQRAATRDVSQAHFDLNQSIMPHSSSHKRPRYSAPSTPTLPSTPDVFNLMPQHKRRKCSSPDPTMDHRHPVAMNGEFDLDKLRSNAFWELQKSVEESGEGFVRKMREQEFRGRKRPQSMVSRRTSNMIGSDDEEDIFILSGDSPRADNLSSSNSPRKKRASSVGTMNLEPPSADVETEAFFPSPVHITPSISSDDDTDYPGSTTSITTHTASSPMSWSFYSDASPPRSLQRSNDSIRNETPSCRSDKAIAALTLALASGVGGLNDYGPLLEDVSLADYEVGELWK